MPLSFKFNLSFFKNPYNPTKLHKKLLERPFQKEIADWVDHTLRPLENPQKYLELCQQDPLFTPSPQIVKKIYHHLHPYTLYGKPGHDIGHLSRDLLVGLAITGNDPYAQKGYLSEAFAAFFSAAYHDIGNGVWHRYQDNFWECAHAEIGAWLFYQTTVSFLPEHIRRLTAYAIAAHTHSLKPIPTKTGYIRQPWADHLFETEDNHVVGIAIWITRFSDRLETCGVTHLCRHLLANIEGSRQEGRDFSGSSWYDLNNDLLNILLKPEAVTINNQPTALKHIDNFAQSAVTLTPYSQHDKKFPVMKELIAYKIKEADTLIHTITTQTQNPDYKGFVKLLTKMSQAKNIKSTIRILDRLYRNLTEEEKSHWGAGFSYIEKAYPEWLELIHQKIRQSKSPLDISCRGLATEIIDQVS